MDYFDDLTLVWGDEYPECRAALDQRFENVCSIQLSLGGPLFFGVERRTPVQTELPLFFWHHPDSSYQYGTIGRGSWHHLWVSFRGPRAMQMLERGYMALKPGGCFSPRETRWAAQAMRELISLSRARAVNRGRGVLLLEELLLWAESEVGEDFPDQSEAYRKVRRIVDQVSERPDRKFNFRRAAAEASLSFSHFRALFRQMTGEPPLDYVLKRLMDKAAVSLSESRLPIEQVGSRAGYEDAAQFSKAFKNRMGISPEAFRRRSQKAR